MVGLAGCTGLGRLRPLTLSQAGLQRAIERHFPLQRRLFEAIDIQVARPTVRLLPERSFVGHQADPERSRQLQQAGVGAADIAVTARGLEVQFAASR